MRTQSFLQIEFSPVPNSPGQNAPDKRRVEKSRFTQIREGHNVLGCPKSSGSHAILVAALPRRFCVAKSDGFSQPLHLHPTAEGDR
jgi:hypothetical protein